MRLWLSGIWNIEYILPKWNVASCLWHPIWFPLMPQAKAVDRVDSWSQEKEGFVLFDDLSQFLITSQSSPILHRVWYEWFPLYLFERPIKCREWENWLFWEDVAIKRPNIGETFGLSHTRDEQENLFNCIYTNENVFLKHILKACYIPILM